MSDESRKTELTTSVKSSILEAIQANIQQEKELSISRLGSVTDIVAALNDIDRYGKNTPGDLYGKNTAGLNPGDMLAQPVEAQQVSRAAKKSK